MIYRVTVNRYGHTFIVADSQEEARAKAERLYTDDFQWEPIGGALRDAEISEEEDDEDNPHADGDKIVNALYTSVWDDEIEIPSRCKVNLRTHEVFDIETAPEPVEMQVSILTGQYITLPDSGTQHPVVQKCDDPSPDEFWYE